MNKIFQIGFNKCGTLSLHELFNSYTEPQLKAIHWDYGKLALSISNNFFNREPLLKDYHEYDVFTDMECCYKIDERTNWIFAYKWFHILDKAYPNSRFILNTRNIDNWILSRLNHECGMMIINNEVVILEPKASYLKNQLEFYGLKSIEEIVNLWKKDWEEHHLNVINYFKNRSQDLLIFNCETDNLEDIKKFFSDIKFTTDQVPHKNKTFKKSLDNADTLW